jgi:hypothetical protein
LALVALAVFTTEALAVTGRLVITLFFQQLHLLAAVEVAVLTTPVATVDLVAVEELMAAEALDKVLELLDKVTTALVVVVAYLAAAAEKEARPVEQPQDQAHHLLLQDLPLLMPQVELAEVVAVVDHLALLTEETAATETLVVAAATVDLA